MDNHLQVLFSTSESTLKRLEDLHVDYVVFDRSAAAQEMPYWTHMNAVVAAAGDRLKPVYQSSRPRRQARHAGSRCIA